MNKFVAALLLTTAPVAASASPANWVFAAQSADAEIRIFYAQSSVTPLNNGNVGALVMLRQSDGTDTVTPVEFDCGRETYRFLGYTEYRAGHPIRKSAQFGSWQFFNDGAVIAGVTQRVC